MNRKTGTGKYEKLVARCRSLEAIPTAVAYPCEETVPVRAPRAAVLLRVFEESERVVSPGTPLVEIGDPTGLEIVVDLLSTDAVKVRPGARVIIDRWGGETSLEGRVRLMSRPASRRSPRSAWRSSGSTCSSTWPARRWGTRVSAIASPSRRASSSTSARQP